MKNCDKEVVCQHSAAHELLSDRGKNFLAEILKAVREFVNMVYLMLCCSYRTEIQETTKESLFYLL